MKKIKTTKKLDLQRTTVKVLRTDEVNAPNGGLLTYPTLVYPCPVA